jgi:tryptophan synthase alpha chain
MFGARRQGRAALRVGCGNVVTSGLTRAFELARAENRAALVAFIMAGDPSPDWTPALLQALVAGGADIIELGFPYSDPLADGPVIQAASGRALAAGMDFDRALACREAAADVPVIAFGYYNPLFVRGVERATCDIAAAGFVGIIAADLPPEEAGPLESACAENDIALPYLVAPTTPPARIALLAARATGFIYAVSRLGVTGADAPPSAGIAACIAQIRDVTTLPVVAGFGISSAADAAAVAATADGVVVGSALVELVSRADSLASASTALESQCRSIASACRRNAEMPVVPA